MRKYLESRIEPGQLVKIDGIIKDLDNRFRKPVSYYITRQRSARVDEISEQVLVKEKIPGQSSDFILEIPPLRIPSLSNIVIKTLARLQLYLKEAVPLFILGSIVLFILSKTGLLILREKAASSLVVNLLDLPREATRGFIMGFLRRDYAIVLITKTGNLSNIQLLVGIVTITLFVPCVANLIIMVKERGIKTAMSSTLTLQKISCHGETLVLVLITVLESIPQMIKPENPLLNT